MTDIDDIQGLLTVSTHENQWMVRKAYIDEVDKRVTDTIDVLVFNPQW